MFQEENRAWQKHLPEGWHKIFQDLLEEITALDPAVKVTQAKEKFGEMRVYLVRSNEEVYGRIDAAGRISRRTCQTCGNEALLCVNRGLFATLCERHREGFKVASSDPILASVRMVEGQVEPILRDTVQFEGKTESGPKGRG